MKQGRTQKWSGICLIIGAALTAPSSFLLHPSLYDPTNVGEVIKDVAKSGDWHWLHVVAALGGFSIVIGYTFWYYSLYLNQKKTTLAPLLALAISWLGLTLWLPLVLFEAAGLPRIAYFINYHHTQIQSDLGFQGIVTVIHGLWSTMLAIAYLVAWCFGLALLLLTETELAINSIKALPLWLRNSVWIASLGTTIALPLAWALPNIAPTILITPGVSYFLSIIALGWLLINFKV